MTTSPEERLARAETRQDAYDSDLADMRADIKDMKKQLAELVALAQVGRGVWLGLLKTGAVLTGIAGGLAWAWDHIPKGH